MPAIVAPLPQFFDLTGAPLEGGYIYIGTAGGNPETSPVAVYWDSALTQPAVQPLRTSRGFVARSGTPAAVYVADSYSLTAKQSDGVRVLYAATSAQTDNSTAVQTALTAHISNLASTASSSVGTGLVGWLRGLTGTVATTLYRMLNWRDPCVFDWMTAAQVADYQARTAVNDLAAALDLTAPIQAAIYASYAAGQNLYFPPGAAKVTGLEAPTDTADYESRGDAWRMYGSGAAQPFVRYPRSGVVLVSETDAPVFAFENRFAAVTAQGNVKVNGIRFEQRNAAAASPVVLWDAMNEEAEFSGNVIVQFGTGDGLKVSYHAKGNIERNFALYGGYFTSTRSVAGIGFHIPSSTDGGMLTLRKNSARSFLWGYVHGDGTNDSSGALFVQNECSDCTNGVWNKAGCTAATFDKTYTEGITGTCIKDEGTMTTITGGMHYLGFTVGIDASAASNYGTCIVGNYLETAGPGCTLIKLGSGGPNKTVRGNHLLFSTSGGSVTNVIGIEITGLNPRLDVSGNAFLPRGAWVGGAGTVKILDSATGGLIGSLPLPSGADLEIPSLLRGAVTYQQAASALTQTDVNGSNVLALPDANSALATASAGCTVTALSQSATFTDGVREVSIRTTNANMSFQDSATLELAGGAAFTGPGILTLQVEVIGGTVYGYEKSRTVF